MAESFLGIHSDIAESILSEFLCAADSAVLTGYSKMVSATLLQLRSNFFTTQDSITSNQREGSELA